jgi:hypothetical protein
MDPLSRVLAADPAHGCKRFTEDLAVHWYPTPLALICCCGEITRSDPKIPVTED